MPSVTLLPNATTNTAFSVVGAASEHAATNDSSDATYATLRGINPAFRVGLGTFTLPAGTVVSYIRGNIRARHSGTQTNVRVVVGVGSTDLYSHVENTTTSFVTHSTILHYPSGGLSQADINSLEIEAYDELLQTELQVAELSLEVVYANPPTAPTIETPLGTVTNTRRPLVDWTFLAGQNGGGQTKYRVKIFTEAVRNGVGFNADTSPTVLDSGWVTSGQTSWTPSSDIPNGNSYYAYVATRATTNGVDQTSGWTSRLFSINLALTAPTGVSPTNASVVTTSKPSIAATITTQPGSAPIKREWNVASNSGFSTGLRTYSDTAFSTTKSGSIAFPAAWARLPAGTWYIRARTIDQVGDTSAWTSTNTFTVQHVPSTGNRSPSGGQSVPTGDVRLGWTFSDPDPTDFQTAYEVEWWLASNPSATTSSGKITSVSQHQFVTFGAPNLNLETRWRVRVWDQDNTASPWSIDQGFVTRQLATVVITAPSGVGSATSAEPTISWTFSATGRTQASFRVVVKNLTTGINVADSGVTASTATSWQVPTPVINVNDSYELTLTTVDSEGLVVITTTTFTATYTAPTTPTFVVSDLDYQSQGRIYIDWSSATQDPTAIGWRVYRRLKGNTEWVLLYNTEDPGEDLFYDYAAPANTDLEYSVVHVAESVGDAIESAYPVQDFHAYSDKYMITVPDDPTLNLTLYHVTGDTFSDEQEVAELNLIGRGRQVSYGTRFGQRGTLSGTFRDQPQMSANAQRLFLEAIRDSGLSTFLITPFGDVWAVALSTASMARIPGLGLRAFATYTIEYVETTA